MAGNEMNLNSRNKKWLALLVLVEIVYFIKWFCWYPSDNATIMYTLNYANGWIGAGFLGSVLKVADRILPWNLQTVNAIYGLNIIGLFIYYILLFVVIKAFLERIPAEKRKAGLYILAMMIAIAFPMFSNDTTFGTGEMYVWGITLLCVLCMITNKFMWSILPLTILAMAITPTFFFRELGSIFALLLMKLSSQDAKNRKKRFYFLAVIFVVNVLLLLASEYSFLNITNAQAENAYVTASVFTQGAGLDIMAHIRGMRMTVPEWHMLEKRKIIYAAVLFAPFFGLLADFVMRGCKKTAGTEKKLKWVLVLPLVFLLPQFAMKAVWGNLLFDLFLGYLLVAMTGICEKGSALSDVIKEEVGMVQKIVSMPMILVIYLALLVPFTGTTICAALDIGLKWFL